MSFIIMEYFQVSGPLYQLLGFKHVAGYDFSPSPAVINRIKEDSKKIQQQKLFSSQFTIILPLQSLRMIECF